MTPNRKLRTTAIAALVAVSTVFAGVSPAVAVDNTQANTVNSNVNADGSQPAGLNIYDGSKLPAGTVKDEDQLKAATDAISEQIAAFGDNEEAKALAKVFGDWETNKVLREQDILGAVNETEQGALEALQARLNEVTATLAAAAQNQADAQASVSAALDADLASKAAFKALVDYLNKVDRKKFNALIKAVNDADVDNEGPNNTKSGLKPIPYVPAKGTVTNEQAHNVIAGIIQHRENIRDIRADRDSSNYVDRYYSKALEKLLNDALVANFLKPYEDSQAALIAAQNTDIVPIQLFMDRSRAQVLVLRIIQARYAVAVRLLELYENDTIGENGGADLQTVKQAYNEAFNSARNSIVNREAVEREQLKTADAEAAKYFKGFSEDLRNDYGIKTDEEYLKFVELRKQAAQRAYNNIVKDREWQTPLEEAQLLDARYFGNSTNAVKELEKAQARAKAAEAAQAAEAAKAAAAAKAVEEAKAREAALQAALDEAKKALDDKGKGDGEGEGNAHKGEGENKFPIVPVAIIGVVLAALAALAAHFPVLAAMLPKI